MSLLRQGVHALQWSVLGELTARILGPLTFVVLARVLVPADFGVVAAATVVVSLAQVLCELGLAKALVQRSDRVEEAAVTAFWMNTVFGLLLSATAWGLAPWVADYFGDKRIGPALRALSPIMLLASLSAVPMALMQRELRFKTLFWSRLVGAVLPAAVGIPVALAGGGFWALVAGTLTGQVAQSTAMWWASGWRPRPAFDRGLAAELLRFGRWALLAALFGWGYGWLDAVVVGRYLGAHDMGLYRTGTALVTLVFGVLFGPLAPVLYALFSRAQDDLVLLRESLLIVVRISALVALPVAMLIYSLRHVLALGLLGQTWRDAAPVVGVLALAQAAAWLVAFNGELYRAVGRPLVEVLVMGPMLGVYVLVYLVSVQHGLDVFVWSRLALSSLGIAVHVLTAWWVVQIAPRHWLRPLGMLALGLVVTVWVPGPWWVAGPLCLATVGLMWRADWPLVVNVHARWRSGGALRPAAGKGA